MPPPPTTPAYEAARPAIGLNEALHRTAEQLKATLGDGTWTAPDEQLIARLHAAAAHDARLASAFVRVAGMVAPPQTLLRPGVAVRVLRASLHRATGTTISSNRRCPGSADLADKGDVSP